MFAKCPAGPSRHGGQSPYVAELFDERQGRVHPGFSSLKKQEAHTAFSSRVLIFTHRKRTVIQNNEIVPMSRFSQHQEKPTDILTRHRGHRMPALVCAVMPFFLLRMSRGVFDRALCREAMCAAFPTSLQSRTPSQEERHRGQHRQHDADAAERKGTRSRGSRKKRRFSFIGFLSPVSFFFALCLHHVADCGDGVIENHPRAGKAHHGADLFTHVGFVAVHAAVDAEGLRLHERAVLGQARA